MPWWLCGWSIVCALCCPAMAEAQATGQVWSELIVQWLATDRLTSQIDVEPKAQPAVPAGTPTWFDVDTTPRVEYAWSPWIDVLGELDVGLKNQNDEVDTTITPRVGAQLHILSRILQDRGARHGAARESQPKRRANISTLLRLEDRVQRSSTDAATKSSWQLRDRLNLAYPMNRPRTTSAGAVYFFSDLELFVPLDGASSGSISELRIRVGPGYRRDFRLRVEPVYVWIGKRDTASGAMAVQSHAIDLRVTLAF